MYLKKNERFFLLLFFMIIKGIEMQNYILLFFREIFFSQKALVLLL